MAAANGKTVDELRKQMEDNRQVDLYKEQLASIKKIYDLKTKRLTVNDGTAMAADIDKQIADVQQ